MGIAATFVTRAFAARAAHQVVMARLLRPDDYAVVTALFGILVESLSSVAPRVA